jgi:hypothetical protein
MASKKRIRKTKNLTVGDRVIEKFSIGSKKRIGEILFVIDGKRKKFELLQLNRHDLSPLLRHNNEQLKFFRLREDQCKKLNEFKYREKKTFRIGNFIRNTSHGRIRYGKIVSFVHPEGLYTESNEKGYNGKDLIECVEVSARKGLTIKFDADGQIKRFSVGPSHCKMCEILPMDEKGGFRIKDFSGIRKDMTDN